MVLHEDSLSSQFKPRVASLIHMFKTHIEMLRDDRISIVHKKNSGKILSEVNKIWWDKELGYISSSPALDNVSDYLLPAPPTAEPLSTFNLGLSESEKLVRDQLILPYVNSGRADQLVSGGGGGMIYVEPEDYDEEDPDDDLDV
uniref:Elongator complex protein 5 n=1 Tax=Cacopsylla melanoneura TaxID=428564 RepID=A0A8D8XTD7_9HEMI